MREMRRNLLAGRYNKDWSYIVRRGLIEFLREDFWGRPGLPEPSTIWTGLNHRTPFENAMDMMRGYCTNYSLRWTSGYAK